MKKSGIVFEGGGFRAIFSAGVIDTLLDNEIYFDSCIGVSAGACHACSYLSRQRGRAFSVTADYLDSRDFISLQNLLFRGGLFGADMLYDRIPRELYPIDNKTFQASGAELYATVTNCETGRAEYMRIYHLLDDIKIVQASASLPMLASPVKIGDFNYLDGGISDSVPIDKALEMGWEKIVLVLTREKGFVMPPSRAASSVRRFYRQYPKLARALEKRHTVYNDAMKKIEELENSGRVFVIRPNTPLNLRTVEKNREKLCEVYDCGLRCAADAAEKLKAYLNE